MTTLAPYIPTLRGIIYIVAGYLIARFASSAVKKLQHLQHKPRYTLFIEKAIFYVIFILFIVSALRQWGFEMKVLLGATGILTIALGFASQTSASNFISGLFLLAEDTLHVGDLVNFNGVQGEIISIGLFSIRVRQYDNTLVRVPNETLIKTPIVNVSHFSKRRLTCDFQVSGNTDIVPLRNSILHMLEKEPLCLKDPQPSVQVTDIGFSYMTVQVWAWAKQKDFSNFKLIIPEKIATTLRENAVAFSDNTLPVKLLKDEAHEKHT